MVVNKKPLNLSQKAYYKIKDLIVKGEIKQGEVLSILLLSEQLGMGRTPIANACQRLECDGLIRVIPKQGILVNMMTIDDAREMYESRVAIETYCAHKAFDKITKSDISYLNEMIEKQFQAKKQRNSYKFMEEDTDFHLYLMKKHNNQTLINLFNNLADKIFLFGIKNVSSGTRFAASIEEHMELLEHISNGEKDSFISALERHIMNGYVSLTGSYQI
jgi:DNA-binding GntR family transcriptional regulator